MVQAPTARRCGTFLRLATVPRSRPANNEPTFGLPPAGLSGLVAKGRRHSLANARFEVFVETALCDRGVKSLRQCGNIALRSQSFEPLDEFGNLAWRKRADGGVELLTEPKVAVAS